MHYNSHKMDVLQYTVAKGKVAIIYRKTTNNLSLFPGAKSSTHCGLVMPYGNINLGQHWLR